jgi:hypothetical protein
MATLSEKLTDLTIENMRLKDTLRSFAHRCLEIIESEPEPNGPIPLQLCTLSPEELVKSSVMVTRRNIAKRVAKEFNIEASSIEVELSYGTLNSEGRDIDSVFVKCTKCGYSTSCYGTSMRSVSRGCALLRANCPRKEKNFYLPPGGE